MGPGDPETSRWGMLRWGFVAHWLRELTILQVLFDAL